MPFTEFCCRSGGSNLNAGTHKGDATEPGTLPSFTYASGTWVASTGVFTVASGNPQLDGVVVGDFASIYADGSTVTGFVSRVTARDSTTITVSLTTKVGTAPTDGTSNRTLRIGGAWAGPSGSINFPGTLTSSGSPPPIAVSGTVGCRLNLKNDQTYSISAEISVSGFFTNGAISGYSSTYGDSGVAHIDGGSNASSSVRVNTTAHVSNLKITSTATTGTATGLYLFQFYGGSLDNVTITGFRGHGLHSAFGGQFRRVWISNCGKASSSYWCLYSESGALHLFDSHIQSSETSVRTIVNVHPSHGATLVNCRIVGGGTAVSYGFYGQGQIINCDFYNLAYAVLNYYAYGIAAINTNFGKCTRVFHSTGATSHFTLLNCGFGGGEYAFLAKVNGTYAELIEEGSYNYSASPWVDEVNGNWNRSEPSASTAGYAGAFDPLGLLVAPTGTEQIGSYSAKGGGARSVNIRGGADQ